MSTGPKAAYNGSLTIDVSSLKEDLVDLPPGGTQGLKHEKPGFDAVIVELQQAKTGALSRLAFRSTSSRVSRPAPPS